MPTFVEISQDKEPPNQGFVLPEAIREEIINAKLDVEVPLKYTDGETGPYKIEIVFRHAEFGTRLFDIEPIKFRLVMPAIDILYCRTDAERISKGKEFDIQVGINSEAPQKVRGIIFGRLISNDNLIHKMYELEPKRISIQGEKDVTWHLKTPLDETKTGKFKAIIEFKSKETFSKKEFDDFLEVRQSKLLRVNSLKGSLEFISPDDEFSLDIEMENIGLEETELEIYPEITLIDGQKTEKPPKGLVTKWSLTPELVTFAPDVKDTLNWSWKAPPEIINGRYNIILTWKDRNTGETDSYKQELFIVKKHHELKLISAISGNDSYGPGEEAQIKIQLSDEGTRSGEEIELEYTIIDIFNQDVYKNSKKISLSDKSSEFNFIWPVPTDIDGAKYDLEIRLLLNDDVLLKRKFSKLFNIELPVRLDLQLIIPGILKSKKLDQDFAKYLLENEKVMRKIEHNELTIYQLNSNTHLFSINDDLITYSKENESKPDHIQTFINGLFSYTLKTKYLTQKRINEDLTFWNQLGFSWASLIQNDSDDGGLALPGFVGKKLSQSTWEANSQSILKPILDSSLKRTNSVKMNKIFKERILKNKSITNSADYKLLTSFVGVISEFNQSQTLNTLSSKSSKNAKAKDLLHELKSIKLFYELEDVLRTGCKFRLMVISKQLQKKFNKLLATWLADARGGQIRRKPDPIKYQALNAGFGYLLLFLTSRIVKTLKMIKQERALSPQKFSKLILYEMLYYFIYMQFIKVRVQYAPEHLTILSGADTKLKKETRGSQESKSNANSVEFARAIGEIKKSAQKFWYFHARWQATYSNYLKNMAKRSDLVYINEHIKITTNPVILKGMRGNKNSSKLILGNNGARSIALFPILALPSIHWSLVEPEGAIINNLYNLKRLIIPPKQTKEIPISITFPKSLSFADYTAILKINTKPVRLLSEIS